MPSGQKQKLAEVSFLRIKIITFFVMVALFCFCFLNDNSWASLVAQLVKNLPAMQETWD